MFARNRLLGFVHRVAGSTRVGRRLAVKVRNQCNMVIANGLCDGSDFSTNGELLLLRALAPQTDCFVDVGAHRGLWSAEYVQNANHRCRGLLFEPNPVLFRVLRRTVEPLDADLEVLGVALADASGTRMFWAEADGGESSSFVSRWARKGATAVSVPTSTLDAELERRGITHVDFLKIDTEGFDYRVLKGAANALRSQQIGLVQFEYNTPWAFAGDTLFACRHFLVEAGYEVFLLKRQGLYTVDWEAYGEYFAYSNLVAASQQVRPRLAHLIVGRL